MDKINPITRLDYPDPDVIRVGDTYYMVSTTMHFMPGGEILRSYDLQNWEHAAYVYDRLDSTPGQTLTGDAHIYGKGMWAATIRYYKGTFYVCFVANDTGKTYLYRAEQIEGPWRKSYIEGFYHDCSLLFDDDDRVYIVYGNKNIYITELDAELKGPKEGGLHRLAVSDEGHPGLGYEGAHFYKINGKYYLFFIHSLRDRWRRVEACFVADSPEGEFRGGDILNDDIGYCNAGVAQGGIVDTPWGDWYAVLFQDRGAVGRIPVLVPVAWEKDYPVFGTDGIIPREFPIKSTKPEYEYEPLVQSDDFKGAKEMDEKLWQQKYGSFGLKSAWQFNHEPDMALTHWDQERGIWQVTCGKICDKVTQAQNTITQRMTYPGCEGMVTVDGALLKDGDYAGLCALQGRFGMVALTRRGGALYLVMQGCEEDASAQQRNTYSVKEWECIPLEGNCARLKLAVDFTNSKDEAEFFYWNQEQAEWRRLGCTQKLRFGLDHFCGCRFGLFAYATEETGGKAAFSEFVYSRNEDTE